MTKRFTDSNVALTLTMLVLLFSSSGALADEPLKIAGLSLQSIVDSSKAGKKALADMKVVVEKERNIFMQKQAVVKKLEQDMKQQSMMMRDSALEEKAVKLNRLKRELALLKGDVKLSMQRAQAKHMRSLMKDILAIIKQYAKDNHYNLIIEKGQGANLLSGAVIYMDEAMDITDDIVKIYDAKFAKPDAGAKPETGVKPETVK